MVINEHIEYRYFSYHCSNIRNFRKLCRVLTMMSYFGLREWRFSNENISQLVKSMKFSEKSTIVQDSGAGVGVSDSMQKLLEFDMRAIDWNEYFIYYLPGITKYFYKVPAARHIHQARQNRR